MKLQQIRDIAADYKSVYGQWKRAYNAEQHMKLGAIEERLDIMYDDVGKALIAAASYIEKLSNKSGVEE